MPDISTITYIGVLVAGFVAFFSPCIIPLLPVYLARFTANAITEPLAHGEETPGTAFPAAKLHYFLRQMFQTLVFVLGLGTAFILMGFGAGALGTVIDGRIPAVIGGFIIVLLGMHQAEFITIPVLNREKKVTASTKAGTGGSWLLGFTYSFGWTPCVGPILATVLVLSTQGNTAFYGATLMAVFTLGLAIPFLLFTIFTTSFSGLIRKKAHLLPHIKQLGGSVLIAVGIWMAISNLSAMSRISTTLQNTSVNEASDVANQAGEAEQAAGSVEIDFTLQDLAGNSVTLSDYSGDRIYLKFWASWCPSCVANLSAFDAFYANQASVDGVTIFTVVAPGAHGEMDAESFKAWFSERGHSFPVLLDEGGAVTAMYGIQAYPTNIFITTDGKIALAQPGSINEDDIENIWNHLGY